MKIRIKCIEETQSKLAYQVVKIENSDKDIIGRIYIKNIGWYTVNNFETVDGKPIPNIDIDIIKMNESIERLEFSDLSKGDILICKTANYKTLIEGSMYKIQELYTINKQKKSWNGVYGTYTDNYIKFEGVSRKLMFNSWNFEKLPLDKAREMVLEQVLNDAPDKVTRIDLRNLRKIEHIQNKEKELLNVLAKSILDKNRHHLSIIEWTVQQLGNKLDLKIEDYNQLLNMKLKDILKLID